MSCRGFAPCPEAKTEPVVIRTSKSEQELAILRGAKQLLLRVAPPHKVHNKTMENHRLHGTKQQRKILIETLGNNNGILEQPNESVVPSALSFNKLIKYRYFNN